MFSVFIDPGRPPAPALPVVPQVKLNQPKPLYPLNDEIVKLIRDQPSEPANGTVSVFIDPGHQPSPKLPVVAQPKLNLPEPSYPLDREIVKFLRDQPEAVATWEMINSVASSFGPPNRAALRELKTQLLSRITPLVHHRYLRRVGRRYLTLR